MKRTFFALMLSTIGITAFASHLQQSVDKLINQVDPKINMGIVVVDLNTGETLYKRNEDRTFIPASNMKLFSDAAALLTLGPDYRFQNQLSTDASSLKNGVLNGSVYIHLSGDPSFTQAHLNELFSQLNAWGIQRIEGNVVLVSSHHSINPYAPGIVAKDLMYSYGAPLAPLMLDENRVTVTVNPAYRAGDPAFVELSTETASFDLNNQVKTSAKTAGCGLDYHMVGENSLTVKGCVGVGQWAVQQRLAIRNPLSYTKRLVELNLTRLHITLGGQVMLGHAPKASLLLATHQSKPINQLMADTLKPSDNLYADSLYLQAANKLHGSPLNWHEAQPVVKNFLQQQTGIDLKTAILTDGSGLSRDDRLTANQTVALLRFLHDRFPLAYEYISALPIAGQDGTLKNRLKKPTQQGLVRAKTGSMTGVMSLSGYLYSANAHTLAFAIFINTTPGTPPNVSGRYRSLVDTLCDFFLNQRPDTNFIVKALNAHKRVAFQQQPNQGDRQRNQQSKWRRIEANIKQALKGQAVTVLFRNEQLVLIDQGADINKVWSVLQALSKKYAFTVALHAETSPSGDKKAPQLLWVSSDNRDKLRTWTIRESVG